MGSEMCIRDRDHANQIAYRLRRADLAFTDEDYGSLVGYEKYGRAVQAWSLSPLTRTTYFDPGTDAKAAKVLESCRTRERKVRLILGDTSTGEPWLEEHDVVGRIGRSTGSLKVPLLIEPGEHGGSAIPVSYTHLRAHETVLDLVCRLLLEKKKQQYACPSVC